MAWRLPNIPLPQPSPSDTLSHAVEDLKKIYPVSFDVRKYLYLPHGKFAFTSTHLLECHDDIYPLSHDLHGSSSALVKGTISGHTVTCMIETWNVPNSWKAFFVELYILSHPKLLRWLQGVCIPHVIGVFSSGAGRLSIVMETPHPVGWHTAHPGMPAYAKEAVVNAFEMIHAQGVMHGDIANQNILIGDDGTVTIINFGKCACFPDFDLSGRLPTCSRSDLEREMRAVKYCIRYHDAKELEQGLLSTSENSKNICPLPVEEMVRWDKEAEGNYDDTYITIPQRLRTRPTLNDGRPDTVTRSAEHPTAPEGLTTDPNFGPHISIANSAPTMRRRGTVQHSCNREALARRLSRWSVAHHPRRMRSAPGDQSRSAPSIGLGVQRVPPSKRSSSGSNAVSSTNSDLQYITPSYDSPSVTNPCTPMSPTSATHSQQTPESFLEYTSEQVRLVLKRQREADDVDDLEVSRNVRQCRGPGAEKKGVVFHSSTHDNGLWSTNEEPMRTVHRKWAPRGPDFVPLWDEFALSESKEGMHVDFDAMHRHCRQHVKKVMADRRHRREARIKMRERIVPSILPPSTQPLTREDVTETSDVSSQWSSVVSPAVDDQQNKGADVPRTKGKHPPHSTSTHISNGSRDVWRSGPATRALSNTYVARLTHGQGVDGTSNAAALPRKRTISEVERPELHGGKRPRLDSACCIC